MTVRSSFLLVLLLSTRVVAATLKVPQDYPTIQAAIDASADGDTVLVSAGTYPENITFLGKTVVVTSESGPDVTTIDASAGRGVAFQSGETSAAVLSGFTITGGVGSGGGVFISGSSPIIRGNKIVRNGLDASRVGPGGGIYCIDGSPLIENNTISDNIGADRGGGLCCVGGGYPTISGNVISRNQAELGAGIYVDNGAILGNTIDDNLGINGGGVACQTALISDNAITLNQAGVFPLQGSGGGIQCSGGTIRGNSIQNNFAMGEGGAIACVGDTTIRSNTIVGNHTSGDGGGISCGDNAIIELNTISANGANANGGGILASGSPTIRGTLVARNEAMEGAGIWCSFDSSPLILSDTIVQNQASDVGGGIVGRDTTTIANCTVFDNIAPLRPEIKGQPVVTYSDIEGGYTGTGNIDQDPSFVDPVGGDFSIADDSPCIDIGDPTILNCDQDLAGNPRRLDGHLSGRARVDMGAFEFDNVSLAILGSPTPGGVLTIVTSGTSNLQVLLFVALVPGATCVPPYGTLYFSFTGGWNVFLWGVIPSSIAVVIPSDVRVPLQVVVQEIALAAVYGVGNTSNPVTLTIE